MKVRVEKDIIYLDPEDAIEKIRLEEFDKYGIRVTSTSSSGGLGICSPRLANLENFNLTADDLKIIMYSLGLAEGHIAGPALGKVIETLVNVH